MSIRFSQVNAITETKSAIFLVGGTPRSQDDLNGWEAFQSFIADLAVNTPITVYVETFLYGEDEPFDATPEEVAYIYMRIQMRPDFIESRTEKVEESEFFIWLSK